MENGKLLKALFGLFATMIYLGIKTGLISGVIIIMLSIFLDIQIHNLGQIYIIGVVSLFVATFLIFPSENKLFGSFRRVLSL